jgi:hypothetical protein
MSRHVTLPRGILILWVSIVVFACLYAAYQRYHHPHPQRIHVRFTQ